MISVKITQLQASWLADLGQSGSETYAQAVDAGLRIERAGAQCRLIIPDAAVSALGTAVGIRADMADEGEYSIGERTSVLSLARKLSAAGVTKAAPLPSI